MKVIDKNDVKEEEVEDAKKTTIRWLIDENLAENFAMRYFVIGKGGNTPLHSHDWEHEIFVVKGEGYIHNGNEKIKIKKGNAIFIEPNEVHQLINEDSESLEVICLIPIKK